MPNVPETAEATEARAIAASLARGATRERLLEILLEVRDAKGGLGISEGGLRQVAEHLRLFPSEAYEVATALPSVNYMASTPYTMEACGDLVCSLLHGATANHGACRNLCGGTRTEPRPRNFADYRASGGYKVLDDLGSDPDSAARILKQIGDHQAARQGHVSFPMIEKWRQAMTAGATPVVIVNGDEGELAVFKDRLILESDPHGVIEAALVAARIIGADRIFLYVRDDYASVHAIVKQAIEDVVGAGLAVGLTLELRRSGGAYICGEETALIASLEGRPARPRERPPFPYTQGYFGRPTLVHNVETLFRLRAAWDTDPDHGIPISSLLHADAAIYSVSGRVRHPGPKLVRGLGRLADLVDAAGGLAEGAELGGMVVGGSSGTLVSAADCARPFSDLCKEGLQLGTGGVIVFGAADDRRAIAAKMASYLARESCGQCGPCRVGTKKALDALTAPGSLDAPLLDDLSVVMSEASLCALGRNAGRFLGRLSPLLKASQK